MPWWAGLLIGLGAGLLVGYLGLTWYLRNWGRDF